MEEDYYGFDLPVTFVARQYVLKMCRLCVLLTFFSFVSGKISRCVAPLFLPKNPACCIAALSAGSGAQRCHCSPLYQSRGIQQLCDTGLLSHEIATKRASLPFRRCEYLLVGHRCEPAGRGL